MADPIDLLKKRNEQTKQNVLDTLLRDKSSTTEAIHLDPYLILFDKDSRTIQVLRFEETGVRKLFQDPPG